MVSILFINQWFIQGRAPTAAQPVALRLRAPIQLSNHILPQLVARPSIHTCNSQGFIPFLSWERVFNPCAIFIQGFIYSFLWEETSQPTHLQGRNILFYRMLNCQYPCTVHTHVSFQLCGPHSTRFTIE